MARVGLCRLGLGVGDVKVMVLCCDSGGRWSYHTVGEQECEGVGEDGGFFRVRGRG